MVGVAHDGGIKVRGNTISGTPDHLIPRAERTEPMLSDEIVG